MSREQILETLRTVLPREEWDAMYSWASPECFFKYQLDWMFDQSKFALYNKSRQIGISHATAGWAVLRGVFFGEATTVVSVGQREADEVINKAAKHAEILHRLGSRWAFTKPTTSKLVFKSGGSILAVPSSSGGRSFSSNVLLDEFAYVQNQEKLWDGASPVTLHDYAMRVVSTPNGTGDKFWELYEKAKLDPKWSVHETSIDDAIADGMNVDIEECWSMARHDERLFNQFFRCSFLDGAEQYIPTRALMDALEDRTWKYKEDAPITVAGLDIGGEHDLTALAVVRITPDGRRWVQEVKTCRRSDWDEQKKMIRESWSKYKWSRLAVDSTGLGTVPTQDLEKTYGKDVVESYKFTLQSKEVLATGLLTHFNKKIDAPAGDLQSRKKVPLIALPKDDKDLYVDLASIKRIVTEAGNIKYEAPRTSKGHADRAWALALALYVGSMKQPMRDLTNIRTA